MPSHIISSDSNIFEPIYHNDHSDYGYCQDCFQTGDTEFNSITHVVRYFIPYYKECLSQSKEESYRFIWSHVRNICDRNDIIDKSGNDYESVIQLIDNYW